MHVCFQVVAFVREHLVIYKAFYLDVAKGHMNGAPNEAQTHSFRFASRLANLNVLWRKWPAGNTRVCKNEINNSEKI